MPAEVETMAYAKSGGVPWHGFGNPVHNKMTPKEMCAASTTDWTVSKHDIFWLPNGSDTYEKVEGKAILVRDSDNQQLSVVGSTWKPVQNEDAVDFFKKFTQAGHMEMETMGSLWFGRYIWALARIKKSDFVIGKGSNGDEVRSFLLLCSPHVIGRALIIQNSPIRVVCWNTLQLALGASLKGKKGAFRMPHSIAFDDDTKKQAEEALGLSIQQMSEFQEAAQLLAKKKASHDDVEEYFCECIKFNPKDKEKKEPRMLQSFRLALTYAPGQQLPSAEGTWWGALNAISHVVDHQLGNERTTALRTAWFGTRSVLKRRALDLALKRAA